MRKIIALVAAAVLASAVASAAAFGRDARHSAQAAKVTILQDLWLEPVGQFQNSAPGVTPVTHVHYGYLSYVRGVAAFKAAPHGETTALFTFFADGTTSPVISNGPFREATRVGRLTIYRDPSTNSDFANPDTFRDGTPVLVAQYRQQSITNTLTSAITTFHRDTITLTKPFDTGHGKVQLGKIGKKFDEHYNGQGNMPGPPSGYFVGYAVSR
jgi:hypothetical protein